MTAYGPNVYLTLYVAARADSHMLEDTIDSFSKKNGKDKNNNNNNISSSNNNNDSRKAASAGAGRGRDSKEDRHWNNNNNNKANSLGSLWKRKPK